MPTKEAALNVIFDLGNVVLDWNPEKIVSSVNVSHDQQQAIKRELFEHQDWLDLDCGLTTEAVIVPKVSARTGLPETVIEQALATTKASLTPIARSVQLLEEVHAAGLPLYCLSNMSVETYSYLEANMDFFHRFDGIVISGVEKCMKPDSAIFELLLERHGLKASESFFVDDSAPNIEMSKALGLHAHHFQRTDECYFRIRQMLPAPR